MIMSLLYQLTRRLLSVPAVLLHRDTTKDAELLVLRHENSVLRRQITSQVRYEPADLFWFAALSSLLPDAAGTRSSPSNPPRPSPGNAVHRQEMGLQRAPTPTGSCTCRELLGDQLVVLKEEFLQRVLDGLEPELRAAAPATAVAVDGKTMRAATTGQTSMPQTLVVAAMNSRGEVLGQTAVNAGDDNAAARDLITRPGRKPWKAR
ncbi:hypothetical protein [Saccharopolyspora shandongensis]|uniref:hypothetical protein n=1 Tax=Saccharopolyspora shandongensis TaxID=418495 RepID=UPI0033D2B1B4